MSIPAAVEEEINEEAPEHQGPYQSKRAANKTITKNAEVQPSSKSKKKQAKISKVLYNFFTNWPVRLYNT